MDKKLLWLLLLPFFGPMFAVKKISEKASPVISLVPKDKKSVKIKRAVAVQFASWIIAFAIFVYVVFVADLNIEIQLAIVAVVFHLLNVVEFFAWCVILKTASKIVKEVYPDEKAVCDAISETESDEKKPLPLKSSDKQVLKHKRVYIIKNLLGALFIYIPVAILATILLAELAPDASPSIVIPAGVLIVVVFPVWLFLFSKFTHVVMDGKKISTISKFKKKEWLWKDIVSVTLDCKSSVPSWMKNQGDRDMWVLRFKSCNVDEECIVPIYMKWTVSQIKKGCPDKRVFQMIEKALEPAIKK